jgi:hypothetical protein
MTFDTLRRMQSEQLFLVREIVKGSCPFGLVFCVLGARLASLQGLAVPCSIA